MQTNSKSETKFFDAYAQCYKLQDQDAVTEHINENEGILDFCNYYDCFMEDYAMSFMEQYQEVVKHNLLDEISERMCTLGETIWEAAREYDVQV